MTTSSNFVHPWYLQQHEPENTTTAEFSSKLNHPQDQIGERLTDFDALSWAAGLFEGEGSLSQKTEGTWVLKLKMTDVDVVKQFASMYGLKVNAWKHSTPEHYKQPFETATGKRDLIFQIVSDFYPYLGKRRRAKCDEFLMWYAAKTGKRFD